MLRISFLTRSLERFFDHYDMLVDDLHQTGVEVEVVAPPPATEVNTRGASVKLIPSTRTWSPLRDSLVGPILVAHYSGAPPGLVHVTDATLLGAARFAVRTLRIPYLAFSLDDPRPDLPSWVVAPLTGVATKLRRRLVRQLAPTVSLAIIHGRHNYQETLLALPADNTRIVVPLDTGMGIEVERFLRDSGHARARKAARAALGLSQDVVIGLPVFDAGLATVNACVQLANHARDAGLGVVFSGASTLHPILRRHLQAHTRGCVFTEHRREMYEAVDLLIAPGPTARQALYLMEGAANRVPALVSAIPLHVAIVRDGVSGWVAEEAKLEATLDRVVATPRRLRHAAREAQTRAARLFERRLSVKRITRAYEQMFADPTEVTMGEDGRLGVATLSPEARDLVKEPRR